jgi:hypothetical protein
MLLAFRDQTGKVRYVMSGDVSLDNQSSLRAIIAMETKLVPQSAIVAVIDGGKEDDQ